MQKKQINLCAILLGLLFLCCCGGNLPPQQTLTVSTKEPSTMTATNTDTVSSDHSVPLQSQLTEPSVTTLVLPQELTFGRGHLVSCSVAEVPNYSVTGFTESPEDVSLVACAPSLTVEMNYEWDSLFFQYTFADGRIPDSEMLWFFREDSLVTSGVIGTQPEDGGDYLLYVDFLYAQNGGVVAERTVIKLHLIRSEWYDEQLTAELPRGNPLFLDQKNASYFSTTVYPWSEPFCAVSNDPQTIISAMLTQNLACSQESLLFHSVEQIGVTLIDQFDVHIFSYDVSVENNRYSETVWLKRWDDGSWLQIDKIIGLNHYNQEYGYRYCGSDPWLLEYLTPNYPSEPIIPAYQKADLYDKWSYFSAPDYISWNTMREISGTEYCEYQFAILRTVAFNSQAARLAMEDSILGRGKDMPQALRTVMVMYAANDLYPEMSLRFSELLKELQIIDPESFAYALTQLPEVRAEAIRELVAQ